MKSVDIAKNIRSKIPNPSTMDDNPLKELDSLSSNPTVNSITDKSSSLGCGELLQEEADKFRKGINFDLDFELGKIGKLKGFNLKGLDLSFKLPNLFFDASFKLENYLNGLDLDLDFDLNLDFLENIFKDIDDISFDIGNLFSSENDLDVNIDDVIEGLECVVAISSISNNKQVSLFKNVLHNKKELIGSLTEAGDLIHTIDFKKDFLDPFKGKLKNKLNELSSKFKKLKSISDNPCGMAKEFSEEDFEQEPIGFDFPKDKYKEIGNKFKNLKNKFSKLNDSTENNTPDCIKKLQDLNSQFKDRDNLFDKLSDASKVVKSLKPLSAKTASLKQELNNKITNKLPTGSNSLSSLGLDTKKNQFNKLLGTGAEVKQIASKYKTQISGTKLNKKNATSLLKQLKEDSKYVSGLIESNTGSMSATNFNLDKSTSKLKSFLKK